MISEIWKSQVERLRDRQVGKPLYAKSQAFSLYTLTHKYWRKGRHFQSMDRIVLCVEAGVFCVLFCATPRLRIHRILEGSYLKAMVHETGACLKFLCPVVVRRDF